MFDAFHFLRPEWFYALPIIALMLFSLLKRSARQSGWEDVCDAELLQFQLINPTIKKTSSWQWSHWSIPLLFLLTIIALAGPTWEKKDQPIFQQGHALVILFDLSLSMNAQDIKPSRLERAKLKLIDILKQKKEGQTALIAFSGDAHVVSPLTIDNKTIISLLPALDTSIMPLSGSDILDALKNAKKLFQNAGFSHGDILLISDGIDPTQQQELETLTTQLYKQGYHLSIIGVGTSSGSPIPKQDADGFVKDQSGQVVLSRLSSQSLETLSTLGGGSYHKLSLDDSDFKELINQRTRVDDAMIKQDNQIEQWVDAGAYLSLALIPLALFGFRKGLLSIVIIIMFSPALFIQPTYAEQVKQETEPSTWQKLWSTEDQLAQKAFNNKDYSRAAHSFKDKKWQASAEYRKGDFEKAIAHYSQFDDANSLYNKGNSLANLKKFDQALEAYQQALKKQPNFKKAQKNADYMKKIIEQQKKNQSKKNSDKNSDQKKSDQNKKPANKQDSDKQKNKSDKGNKSSKNEQDKSQAKNKQGSNSQDNKSDADKKKKKQQEKSQQKNPKQSDQQKSNEAKSPDELKKPQQQPKAQEKQKKNKDNKKNDPTKEQPQKAQDIMSKLSQEEQQSLKQWLQRIPDNPGNLLRVKFRNNTLLKQREANTATQYEGKPW